MLSCLTLPAFSPCEKHTREYHFSGPGLTLTAAAVTFSSLLLFLNKNQKIQPRWIWAAVVIFADHQIASKLTNKPLQNSILTNSLITTSAAVTSFAFALTPICSSYFSTNRRLATLGILGLIGLGFSALRIGYETYKDKTGS
ncbi:MAG: hypothetical protein ChlgKO_10800 [Chlamydiales bacterium]